MTFQQNYFNKFKQTSYALNKAINMHVLQNKAILIWYVHVFSDKHYTNSSDIKTMKMYWQILYILYNIDKHIQCFNFGLIYLIMVCYVLDVTKLGIHILICKLTTSIRFLQQITFNVQFNWNKNTVKFWLVNLQVIVY